MLESIPVDLLASSDSFISFIWMREAFFACTTSLQSDAGFTVSTV